MKTRWIAIAILVALAVSFAPLSSRAQSTIPMISHGIINATVASVNAANTTAEILLYEFTVPASFLAS
jgi:VanZ family protein